MNYYVELVWNRSFDFVPYGPEFSDIGLAVKYAEELENMGDGASVKKTRILDHDGNIVWAYGKMCLPPPPPLSVA